MSANDYKRPQYKTTFEAIRTAASCLQVLLSLAIAARVFGVI